MTRTGIRQSSRRTRKPLRAPGRPPVGRREDRVRFWEAIARGLYPGAAVATARVPWVVGARWFRQAGGMPPTHLAPSAPPLSGRYLSFAERELLARRPPPEAGETGQPRATATVCTGSLSGRDHYPEWRAGVGTVRAVEGAPTRPAPASALGPCLEPGADCPSTPAGLPG